MSNPTHPPLSHSLFTRIFYIVEQILICLGK